VSCGEEHTAFVSDIGGHVYAMGSNAEGKLGVGERTLKYSNVPCLVEGIQNVKKVSCGLSHSLAITEEGRAFSWGQGFYGALGINKHGLDTLYSPERIESLSRLKIDDVAAGSRHSLFLDDTGRVHSCGDGKSGQLGLGSSKSTERVMQPMPIESGLPTRIAGVSCGKFHSLFLTEENEVYASGGNSFGQLGVGSKKNLFTPEKVKGLQNVVAVSAWHYSAAVTEDSRLYAWGTGIFGESLEPKEMKFKGALTHDVRAISVGGAFSVILDGKGKAYAWGANTNGEIGLGDTQPRIQPTLLDSIEDKEINTIAVGSAFAFALGSRMTNGDNYQSYQTEMQGSLD